MGTKNLIMTRNIRLKLYDLSNGMAKGLGQLIGLEVEGIWHSGVEIDNSNEYFFSGGINMCNTSQTEELYSYKCTKTVDVCTTTKTDEEISQWINDNNHKYTEDTYHIIEHNCNHFS